MEIHDWVRHRAGVEDQITILHWTPDEQADGFVYVHPRPPPDATR